MVNTATMSKIVVILICLGLISLMNKMIKTQYTEVDLIMKVIWHAISPTQSMTKSTTLTNYCLCTCCHKTDIPRSQCIIFKESKYNFGNALFKKHYLTNSQFLHQRNTFTKTVTNSRKNANK